MGLDVSFKRICAASLVQTCQYDQQPELEGVPTWKSPPRSGPSLQPHNHSCHHLTCCSGSSVGPGRSVGADVAFIGATRGPVSLGGGVRGRGSPNGCGGGTRVDVRWSTAGWEDGVSESNASGERGDEGSETSVITLDCSLEGDPLSDGCMNGFSDTRGLWSMSLRGTASESTELWDRWLLSPPPVDALLACRLDRSTLALRVTAPSKDGPLPPLPMCADSRAALRRSRSAISHRRRFCQNWKWFNMISEQTNMKNRAGGSCTYVGRGKRAQRTSSTRRVSAASSLVGGYEFSMGSS